MIAETVEPASGLVTVTTGGLLPLFPTVTRATAEVPVIPDVGSVVWAAIQWDPFGTVLVSHASMYGELTALPSGCPSSRNCTAAPLAGLAVRVAIPDTTVWSAGELRVMSGGGIRIGTTVRFAVTVFPLIVRSTSVSLLLLSLSARKLFGSTMTRSQ